MQFNETGTGRFQPLGSANYLQTICSPRSQAALDLGVAFVPYLFLSVARVTFEGLCIVLDRIIP